MHVTGWEIKKRRTEPEYVPGVHIKPRKRKEKYENLLMNLAQFWINELFFGSQIVTYDCQKKKCEFSTDGPTIFNWSGDIQFKKMFSREVGSLKRDRFNKLHSKRIMVGMKISMQREMKEPPKTSEKVINIVLFELI